MAVLVVCIVDVDLWIGCLLLLTQVGLLQRPVTNILVDVLWNLRGDDRLPDLEVLLFQLSSHHAGVLVTGLVRHHHVVDSLDLRQLLLDKPSLHRQLVV